MAYATLATHRPHRRTLRCHRFRSLLRTEKPPLVRSSGGQAPSGSLRDAVEIEAVARIAVRAATGHARVAEDLPAAGVTLRASLTLIPKMQNADTGRMSRFRSPRRKSPAPPTKPLAPLDDLGREIQAILALVSPQYADEVVPRFDGYCGAASEAYLHLAGSRDSGLRVMRAGNPGGGSHWWLEGPRGVIDLTWAPSDRRRLKEEPESRYPYERGEPKMFMNGYDKPSKRAAALIALVEMRRST